MTDVKIIISVNIGTTRIASGR